MKIPEYVLNIATKLHKGGYQAWVVGGSIRDLIINRPAYDYDLATSALPERVMKLLKKDRSHRYKARHRYSCNQLRQCRSHHIQERR